MRPFRLVVVGVLAYLAFLVATLPARVVTARIAIPPGVRLEAVEGSAWHGTMRVALDTPTGPASLDGVAWSFAPTALLRGQLAFDVRAASLLLEGQARIAKSFTGVVADDVALQADAKLAAAIAPIVAAWRPQGRFALTASHLAWDQHDDVRGDAQAEWRKAVIALPDPRALGSYRVVVHGEGGPARVQLTTLEGALALRGEGTWSPAAFAFQGDARGQGLDAESVAPVLDLIGAKRADGARALALRWP